MNPPKINDALRTTTDHLELSYLLPLAIKITSLSLNHYPTLHAALDLPKVAIFPFPRPRELAVPVVKDLQLLSLLDIVTELKR
mmetsp:Transcript_61156/g.72609  ORF Transcript_61156/g.72609 Transcript_61156/m.72609 type:complete len:83 (+) Transcript_61156:287-535(+)